jgi:hypothetical protein
VHERKGQNGIQRWKLRPQASFSGWVNSTL